MAYDSEKIGKATKALLQAELPDTLDAVEVDWTGEGDPVTLPDPVTWFEGHKPTVLEMDSAAFPFVAIIVPETSPRVRPCRWGYQEQDVTIYVDFFVVAADEATVNKIAHRYAQAIRQVLQTERVLEGYQQTDYEPRVVLSVAGRHAKVETSADMFDEADVDFIQGGRVTVMLGGG